MDFIDSIKQLASRVNKLKDAISTEEATKMSLIVPLFQVLGYDVFNPEEFLPEFSADVGIKKNEKVDYAIVINGAPTILVECKWCGVALEKHDSQLFRYFGTTTAKFAILTNGVIYKFYTDLDEANKMDLTPFLEIDLLNLKENLIPELKKFHKDSFDPEALVSVASELKYSKAIKEFFESELKTPTDDFVKYFTARVYDGVKTQAIIERFTAIIKSALNDYINEKVNEKIKSALITNTPTEPTESSAQAEEKVEEINKIVTTTSEIEAYYIVKSMVNGILPSNRVSYKDTETYFSVIIDNKVTQWLCRIKLDGAKKSITFQMPDKTLNRIPIDKPDDIFAYRDILLEVASRFS